MRRAIYEDDVIKLLDKGWKSGVYPVASNIHALTSAQQEPDWIPVTKKAHPDKEGKYLVTDDAGGMADSTWDEFIFCDDGTPSWMYSQNVTAWKPFPEPWRGEE